MRGSSRPGTPVRFLACLCLTAASLIAPAFSASAATSSTAATAVDATTLQGKVVFGYQGWFDCPMAGQGSWIHWSRNGAPTASTLTVDLYPDLKEFAAADLCPAGDFKIAGKQAQLYSARNANVVDAHFRWMEENGLDGVLVQRFGGETSWKKSSGDVVLKNIMASATKHGRVFAIEYDISGLNDGNINATIQNDWMYLVDEIKVTSHPNYLHEGGKPVLAIWGLGLNDGHPPADPAAAAAFIKWFRSDAAAKYRVYYVGGTPAYWKGLKEDARTDPLWKNVYKAMDVVQPWTVGRYIDSAGVGRWQKDMLAPDIAQTKTDGQQYMPVIFPGFSWKNLNNGPGNQIPRRGGKFFWQQAMNARAAGATMLKIAMFDEVDEGTAMFKVASKRSDAPDAGYWLTLDADGNDLPSDWYLKLAGEVTKVFHGARPISDTIPIRPGAASNPVRPIPAGSLKGFSAQAVAGGAFLLTGPAVDGILEVHATDGKLLRSLPFQKGRVEWDRRDGTGRAVPAGIYLVRMPSGKVPGLRLALQ